ncbi:MAG: tRNA preQ1(34) S-adenosylmethionine ribosyltransferase-isomerase QueA [Candidatus Saganbacteria bacterium]|nr:tRNA preQ1(34) S-adenosylmethionine ribosyltransferase-isomerase QueA [Candidatus Saganbacteria bacterium]
MTLTSEFDYPLPEDLIASKPLGKRDSSRLMIIDRESRETAHKKFSDLPDYLQKGDLLILNDTKVIPARLFGRKVNGGGKVEVLLLKKILFEENTWECLVQPAKRVKKGYEIDFEKCRGTVIKEVDDLRRIIKFDCEGDLNSLLEEIGKVPLPPYISQRLDEPQRNSSEMKERYQTVYAKKEGASAAPTAGLHFTKELLVAIETKGVEMASITLHPGVGTFKPVTAERIEDHEMFEEEYEIGPEVEFYINKAKKDKHKVVAVGTTVVRTLEDCFLKHGKVKETKDSAKIFIYPPFKFNVVDRMITNFHFPKSTLLMLVSAFAGNETIKRAYETAIKERYRFYSFGDAMLIL